MGMPMLVIRNMRLALVLLAMLQIVVLSLVIGNPRIISKPGVLPLVEDET